MPKPIIPVLIRNPALLEQVRASLEDTAELRPYSRLGDFKAASDQAALQGLSMVIVSDLPHPDSSAPDGMATPGIALVDWLRKRQPSLPVVLVIESTQGWAGVGQAWLNQPNLEVVSVPNLPRLDLKKHVADRGRHVG